jgi:CTP synthase
MQSLDAETIYDVPLMMKEEELDVVVLEKLNMPVSAEHDLTQWQEFIHKLKNPKKEIKIGLIGKYVELKDSYKSISESLIHAGVSNDCKVKVEWIHSSDINPENVAEKLWGLRGILVAPGFGERGIEGKITAIQFARENNLPFFGICLGMQCAVIEFARNVLKLNDAHSKEMNSGTPHPVISIMETQKNVTEKGGTMRLGAYQCRIKKDSRAFDIYGRDEISERHRHRYEFNNEYLDEFEKAGMSASGINQEGLVEMVEIPSHPWFVGVQFHPEYKSTVANPHPLFVNFVKAAIEVRELVN